MFYSIGDVAKRTGLAISTLRYYDRESLFSDMDRSNGGIRVFSEKELATIKVIECLKSSGMPIVAIREFLNWCREGDASLEKRRVMFHERLAEDDRAEHIHPPGTHGVHSRTLPKRST